MRRLMTLRMLAMSAAVVLVPTFGCGGEGGGGGGDGSVGLFASENLPTVSSFFDDFSGEFPGENWRIKEGAPAVDADLGNPAPGLAMNPAPMESRVRGGFIFSTAGPLTVSFDVGMPEFAAGQTGQFEIEMEDGNEEAEAEFELRLDDGRIEFEIGDTEADVAFAGDADFHTFVFSIDADQTATWSMDGTVVATRANFPAQLVRFEIRVDGGSTALFVVDNVSITNESGGGGGGGGGGNVVSEFADDFSGGFPGDAWVVEDGVPVLDETQGNPAPGLAFGPSNDNIRVESAFTISSADPFTLSIDLATPDLGAATAGRFEFKLERDCMSDDEASFEIRLEDGEIRLEILGDEVDVPFVADEAFHTITFSVDADGNATWALDGMTLMTTGDFPQGLFRIRLDAHGGGPGFVVDNVNLTSP